MFHKFIKRYYLSRKEHYLRLAFPKNKQEFDQLTAVLNTVMADKSLCYNDIPFGSDTLFLYRVMGKPNYTIEANSFSHKICFYKKLILDHELIVQFHFFNDKLVCAAQSVFESNQEWRTLVKNTLLEKFGISKGPEHLEKEGAANFSITDRENNLLTIIDKFFLTIFYTTGNLQLRSEITNHELLKKQAVINKQQELKNALLDQL